MLAAAAAFDARIAAVERHGTVLSPGVDIGSGRARQMSRPTTPLTPSNMYTSLYTSSSHSRHDDDADDEKQALV